MPATKKKSISSGRRSEPKLFRCTGFGDCDMVFTRSEHLARHARKHTGEKPFKCVVPNCDRMFSRFDNMMQHTHTHNRSKKKEPGEEKKSPSSRSSSVSLVSAPNTPITEQKLYMEHHRILPRSDHYYNSYKQQEDYHHPYYSMPPPPPPPSQQQQQQQHWTPVYYPMVVQQPPSIYTLPHEQQQQPQTSAVSPRMMTDDDITNHKKIELSTPIHELDDTYSTVDIEITPDEFQALQGFGKFCTKPITCEPILMSRITTSPTRSVSLPHGGGCSAQALMSNHVLPHSKVNAFRQYVHPIHESSIRRFNNVF